MLQARHVCWSHVNLGCINWQMPWWWMKASDGHEAGAKIFNMQSTTKHTWFYHSITVIFVIISLKSAHFRKTSLPLSMNWEQDFLEVNRLYTHLCYPIDQQVPWIRLSNAVSGVSLIVYVGHFGCLCCLHPEHWLCPSLFIIIDYIKNRKRWLSHRSNRLSGNVFHCGWEK